ncbi:MAG: alkaline shock response membrane anchor protein AmaP [Chitinophagales bacterium]
MSALWKLIMLLYNLLFIVVAGMAVALAAGYKEPLNWINTAFATRDYRIIAGALGAVLFIAGLTMIGEILKTESVSVVLIQDTPNGSVVITIPAIKQIVMTAVKKVDGIREVKPDVRMVKTGVGISLVISIFPSYKIPEISAVVQDRVREQLEEMAGLRVAEVKVTVDEFATRPVVR